MITMETLCSLTRQECGVAWWWRICSWRQCGRFAFDHHLVLVMGPLGFPAACVATSDRTLTSSGPGDPKKR